MCRHLRKADSSRAAEFYQQGIDAVNVSGGTTARGRRQVPRRHGIGVATTADASPLATAGPSTPGHVRRGGRAGAATYCLDTEFHLAADVSTPASRCSSSGGMTRSSSSTRCRYHVAPSHRGARQAGTARRTPPARTSRSSSGARGTPLTTLVDTQVAGRLRRPGVAGLGVLIQRRPGPHLPKANHRPAAPAVVRRRRPTPPPTSPTSASGCPLRTELMTKAARAGAHECASCACCAS